VLGNDHLTWRGAWLVSWRPYCQQGWKQYCLYLGVHTVYKAENNIVCILASILSTRLKTILFVSWRPYYQQGWKQYCLYLGVHTINKAENNIVCTLQGIWTDNLNTSKAEWKVSDTGSAHWTSSLLKCLPSQYNERSCSCVFYDFSKVTKNSYKVAACEFTLKQKKYKCTIGHEGRTRPCTYIYRTPISW
jgi:hypothetical protein